MAYQNTFKRYELKYLLTKEQRIQIEKAMAPYMVLDEYGRSTIHNIYLDTPDYLLIRRSLEKPLYKEKLRIRSYQTTTKDSEVFVEIKKKYQSIVYKRRISVREEDAMRYFGEGIALPIRNQITREIDYACESYAKLRPAVFLSYEREAYYGREDRELRITFDDHILWRQEELSLCVKPYGKEILEPGSSLMEIKLASAMPLWLAQSLSEYRIFRTSFSKYGNAYLEMQKNEKEGKKEDEYDICGIV